jgi:methyl-accepting chemotaxis protein WspA
VQRSGVRIVSSSTEIFASTKNLLSIASGQAEFANQVLTATKEISATSNALANTINDVGTVSERTKDSVKDSSKLLDRMENTIDMMLDATKTISQKLGIINEKANSIGTIITTIHKIAEQTNLLSLNASIEAEKAGDYGRGFSVIAREIRRLADQTSQSTKNIEIMVYDMQSAVNVGVLEMDKFTQEIRNGASEMDNVNANLEGVISSVQELAPRFQEVSESMQFQLKGVDNINDSIIKLSQGARIIEDSLGEFNAVTTELKEEAESLKKEIARFKVGAGN